MPPTQSSKRTVTTRKPGSIPINPKLAQQQQQKKRRKQGKEDQDGLKKPKQRRNVNFALLDRSALVRYKRHFQLRIRNGASKEELISVVNKHHIAYSVIEHDVVDHFVFRLKGEEQEQQIAPQLQSQPPQQQQTPQQPPQTSPPPAQPQQSPAPQTPQ